MGSFNTTCAVSKTPILEGQKARVFFLVMNTFPLNYHKRTTGLFSNIYAGSQNYPWENFKVIGYPLLGTYENYNNYSFEDKEMESLNLEIVNGLYMPNEVIDGKSISDYNSSHDHMRIPVIKNMEMLQDMEHSGALRVKSCHGVALVCKMAIHEEIFQKLILSGKRKINYDNQPSYFKDHIEYYKEKLLNEELELSSNYDDVIRIHEETLKSQLNKEDKNGNLITLDYIENSINKFKKVMLSSDKRRLFENDKIQRFLEQTYITDDVEKGFSDNVIYAFVTSIWTAEWFLDNRYEFAPVLLSGQDYDYKESAKMLSEISNIVSDLKNRWQDEDSISFEEEHIVKKHLSLKILKEKIEEWYGKKDDTYIEYIKIEKELNKTKPDYIMFNDNSDLSEFLKNKDVVDIVEDKVYLKYN